MLFLSKSNMHSHCESNQNAMGLNVIKIVERRKNFFFNLLALLFDSLWIYIFEGFFHEHGILKIEAFHRHI